MFQNVLNFCTILMCPFLSLWMQSHNVSPYLKVSLQLFCSDKLHLTSCYPGNFPLFLSSYLKSFRLKEFGSLPKKIFIHLGEVYRSLQHAVRVNGSHSGGPVTHGQLCDFSASYLPWLIASLIEHEALMTNSLLTSSLIKVTEKVKRET